VSRARRITAALAISLPLALAVGTAARADQLPLWEAGAGAAVVNLPDYRGSDQNRTHALPIPYVIYRGKTLKVDRQKVRGLLYSSEIAELDVSMSGSVPVRSRDNRAREGMPDLDPTLEIGPSVTTRLYRGMSDRVTLELRLPLRAVESIDWHGVHHEGWLFHPHLNVDVKGVVPGPGWNLGLVAGPLFGSRGYHDYFYGVPPALARPDRPAYDAKAGYAGMQFVAALSKRFENYWFGAFVKADSLHGAAFVDSPLVRRKYAIAGGVAVAWVFAKSSTLVEARE
jgi:outer membrane scaffolding protein for murein synthesis (MipA/OmpV family)